MTKLANPFVLGKYSGDYYFCDRESETEQLRKHIINGRNVTLASQRRMGKTDLIKHLFNQKDIKNSYFTTFVDIYATKNLTEFAYLLSQAVYHVVKTDFRHQVENFFKSVVSLKVGLKFDNITGEPIFDLRLGQITNPTETLSQLFKYLDKVSKPVVIAIDEFQQISNYPETNTEALLRTLIQHCSNAQFIFAGSKKHMLSNMFYSPSHPFYQSTLFMGLEPIPIEVYGQFVRRRFEDYDKNIDNKVIESVYNQCFGVTWYNQVMMNELFSETPIGGRCDESYIPTATSNIVYRNQNMYTDVLARISDRQKAVLLAIAKTDVAKDITSAAYVQENNLHSASSVQSAARVLVQNDLITLDAGTYRVSDIFFGNWLKDY